jgi:CRISPR/Cas system-associated protein Cas10 (large subunit of type III CRISPR-Cas system)
MREHLYLLIVDIDKIQRFIFESTRLKHIVGASIAIASLTSSRFCYDNDLLDESDKRTDIKEVQKGCWMEIYFGGGNMKLLFAEKDDAEKFLRRYQLEFAKAIDSASFTSIIYEIDIGNPDLFEQGLKEAELKLTSLKHSKPTEQNNYANPIFTICPFCNKRVAESGYKLPNPGKNKKEPACKDCYQKEKAQRKEQLDGPLSNTLLAQFVNKYEPSNKFIDEFDQFKSDEGALMAIVTIDGNRFGKKIAERVNARISGKSDDSKVNRYIAELNKISNDIKDATKTAMGVTFEKFKHKLTPGTPGNEQKTLFRPIIIGGDDICFIMDGKLALEFTRKLIAELEKTFSAKGLNLKFAAGITIAKPKFPFFVAHQLSEALMSNVKKINRDLSGFDFEVLYNTSVENLEQMRRTKYQYKRSKEGQTYITTLRPYFFNGKPGNDVHEARYRDFGLTLSIALGLKNRELLARSKIKMLRTLVRKGKVESEYEFNRMLSRLSKEESMGIRNRLERIYPKGDNIWIDMGGCLYNNFIDISELNELYPMEIVKDCNDEGAPARDGRRRK